MSRCFFKKPRIFAVSYKKFFAKTAKRLVNFLLKQNFGYFASFVKEIVKFFSLFSKKVLQSLKL